MAKPSCASLITLGTIKPHQAFNPSLTVNPPPSCWLPLAQVSGSAPNPPQFRETRIRRHGRPRIRVNLTTGELGEFALLGRSSLEDAAAQLTIDRTPDFVHGPDASLLIANFGIDTLQLNSASRPSPCRTRSSPLMAPYGPR
jgi:hypothetical protein